MLKFLRIENVILVENAAITFTCGLNVLSGETGSGKSALIEALGLLLGERADSHVLRHGCEKGSVEALFEAVPRHLLEEAGISYEPDDELHIRREITSSGKSRAWVNQQLVSVSFLKTLGEALIQRIGQHANQELRQPDYQRHLLDLYGGHSLAEFQSAWKDLQAFQRELETLKNNAAARKREQEICLEALEELDAVRLKEGEEEELFAEYSLLAHAEERATKSEEVRQVLSEAMLKLNRQKGTLSRLAELDPAMVEPLELYKTVLIELQEVSYALSRTVEFQPHRFQELNDRLTTINRLKKKYGDIAAAKETFRARLAEKESDDERIDKLVETIKEKTLSTDKLASVLTKERRATALKLSSALEKHLHDLNMPKASFEVRLMKQHRNSFGDETTAFFLMPNVGEPAVAVEDGVSGGELSRLLLSLQVLLAGKASIPTLVFDEIDANIGGETAVAVGEKLKSIGKQHQVLCITHFPQVALHANHHLQISKHEVSGRTVTLVQSLSGALQEAELLRMRGETTCG